MKKAITLFFFALIAEVAPAQNMVHNPGFESYILCPTNASQLDTNHVKEWARPTPYGTSDYHNKCYSYHPGDLPVSTPRNFAGYQSPYEGGAYAGIFTYDNQPSDYREYLQGNLSPLIIGGYYRVSIKVSLADSSVFANDGLGIYFYQNGTVAMPVQTHIPVTPQVDYSSYGVITDTNNWVELVDTFYADSAYTHLIIGNYKDDSNTALVRVNPDNGSEINERGYYYVDMVDVSPLYPNAVIDTKHAKKSVGLPSAFSPNGDGENDILYVRGSGYKQLKLRIYNRLGQVIFETDNATIGWDGTYKGQPQPNEQYGYVLIATFTDGSTTQKTGSITLLK